MQAKTAPFAVLSLETDSTYKGYSLNQFQNTVLHVSTYFNRTCSDVRHIRTEPLLVRPNTLAKELCAGIQGCGHVLLHPRLVEYDNLP